MTAESNRSEAAELAVGYFYFEPGGRVADLSSGEAQLFGYRKHLGAIDSVVLRPRADFALEFFVFDEFLNEPSNSFLPQGNRVF